MTRSPVIDAREALLHLQRAGVCDQAVHFLDSSWHLPTSTRNARQEYEDCHIEGAQFFDIDRMSDPHNPIPHSVPDPAFFASELQKLGLNQDDLVICYEQGPLAMAARAWFLLRLFGHEQVVVLNGGIKAWQEAGGPFSSGRPPAVPKGNFTAQTPSSSHLCSMEELRRIISKGDPNNAILDARSQERFSGLADEPRPSLPSGHMPGAHNIPVTGLSGPDGTLKPKRELQLHFSRYLNPDQTAICTCGSGITACALALSLEWIGHAGPVLLYDGSWCEWAADPTNAIVTAKALSAS